MPAVRTPSPVLDYLFSLGRKKVTGAFFPDLDLKRCCLKFRSCSLATVLAIRYLPT